jgi:hypothetical protein
MPCSSVLPLECTALTEYSEIHLLSGARVYVVYPPREHNMATFFGSILIRLYIPYCDIDTDSECGGDMDMSD